MSHWLPLQTPHIHLLTWTHSAAYMHAGCQWLFFQNAIQVQLHGGTNPIVLYWEMKLQSDLHVSNEPAAASLQRFNWSGPPPRTRNFSRTPGTCTKCSFRKFRVPGRGPDQLNRCKEASARSMLTCSLNCSFISKYNTMGFLPP